MRIDDAPAFAVGLDMELPNCPLPLAKAVRLFWQVDAIRVSERDLDSETAVLVPPHVFDLGSVATGTLH